MIEIIALRNRPVIIGKVGENGTRKVIFNISDWVEEYGSCTAQLLHQRSGDTSPYPCTITRTDGKVEWTVSNSDTEKVGTGQLQLNYTDNGKVVKSSIWTTIVEPSLGTATTPPEPYQSWVDEVLEAAEDAEEAAESAQEAAESAQSYVPSLTGKAGKYLRVKSDESGTEWVEGGGGSGAASWSDLSDKPFTSLDSNTLKVEGGVLTVYTTDTAEEDNTKPITSSGVHVIVGNINALLSLI